MKYKLLVLIFFVFASIVFYSFHNNDEFSNKYAISQLDSSNKLEAELFPVVKQAFDELRVPGAIIGVWMGGHEPFKTTLGVSDLKTSQPITLNDKVRIGSITKTFTGTVLLQLVDEGKIILSDKLNKYFPDFPNGENITIEQMGNMTSGIYNYTEEKTLETNIVKDPTRAYTPQDLIDVAIKNDPYFPPGQDAHYSNTNTILLGLIIEKITGNPLQTEIQNRILIPLGMTNTSFAMDTTFPVPHPQGYIYMDSLATQPENITTLNPSWGWSAGAMISTLDDLSKFAKPMATGQFISSKLQAERLKWGRVFIATSGAWKDKPIRYAFAIADFNDAYGHNGGIPGFNSFMGYIPEKDATIIVFVNMEENQKGIGPADYIARQILEKVKTM